MTISHRKTPFIPALFIIILAVLITAIPVIAQEEAPDSRAFTNMGLSAESGTAVALDESPVTLDMSGLDDEASITGDAFPGTYGDFAAGTTITWGEGDAGDACGFAFRDDAGQYRVTINQNGALNFQDDDTLSVYGYDYNTVNADADNELALLAMGEQFNVYINGKLVWQFRDDEYAEGAISPAGMNALAGDDSGCTFSDTWLRDLSDADITPRMPLALPPSTIEALAAIGLVPNDGELEIYIPENVLEMTTDKNSDSVYLEETYSNFVFGTRFTYAGAAGDNTDHACLVDFRLTPNNNYRLQLSRSGDVGLAPTIDGNRLDNLENLSGAGSANLRVAEGQANDLAIVAYNDELRVYVNHVPAGEFEDSQLDEGIIGLVGTISGEADAGCTFADSWVWTMRDDSAPLSDLISLPEASGAADAAVASIPTATAVPTDPPAPANTATATFTAVPTEPPAPTNTAVPTDTPAPPTLPPTATATLPPEAPAIPDFVVADLAAVGIPADIGTLEAYFSEPLSFNLTAANRVDGVTLPDPYANFVLGTTLTYQGQNIGNDHSCSILFRDDGINAYYRLVFQRDNLIGLLYITGGQSYVLRWQEFRSLNTAAGVPSKILFAVNGSSFNIYVDGQPVPGSFDDTRLITGQISLLGGITSDANPGAGVGCTYTDAWVWVPN